MDPTSRTIKKHPNGPSKWQSAHRPLRDWLWKELSSIATADSCTCHPQNRVVSQCHQCNDVPRGAVYKWMFQRCQGGTLHSCLTPNRQPQQCSLPSCSISSSQDPNIPTACSRAAAMARTPNCWVLSHLKTSALWGGGKHQKVANCLLVLQIVIVLFKP